MPNLTPEKELQILDALKTKTESVEGAENVLVENPLFDSKQDVLEKVCVENVDGETEVSYIYWSLLGYEDSTTDGCDDNPVVYLIYNAHVFRGYKEKRSDNSFSEKDFKALILNLRNKFLQKNRTILANCETTPLKPNNFIVLGDDPLTGAYGHYYDLTLKVEVS
jgi:hypothetical protein